MKKIGHTMLAILLAVSLAACQATPTEAIVKEKNLEKMIEEATKTQEPGSATTGGTQAGATISATAGSGLFERMGAEKKVVKELTDAKGKVKIHVNASVLVPDASSITIQRVEQAQISQDQVDTLVQHLMKGELFSGNDYKPSKSEIQNQILQIQAAMAKIEDGTATASPKDKDDMMMQYILQELQEDLKTAPEQSVKTPITSAFTPIDPDAGGGQELFALSQSAEAYQTFHAYNYSDGISFLRFSSEKNTFSKTLLANFYTRESIETAISTGVYSPMTEEELSAIPDLKITREDAVKTANELVTALGLSDLVCVSAEKLVGGGSDRTADQNAYLNPRRCVWFLRYARSVNGMPVTYTVWDCMKVEQDAQSAPWAYEDMTIAIDDSGVVYLEWRSPYNVTGTVTENSNVLSFQQVMGVFDTMAPVVNAWDGLAEGSPNLTGVEITIDRIQFGLTRVTEQNKRNSGLLVPCWDFFGTMTYIVEQDGKTKKYDDGPIPLLTVNAIDGSIINRSLGY